jgi:hypothetical protein
MPMDYDKPVKVGRCHSRNGGSMMEASLKASRILKATGIKISQFTIPKVP